MIVGTNLSVSYIRLHNKIVDDNTYSNIIEYNSAMQVASSLMGPEVQPKMINIFVGCGSLNYL